MRPPPQTQDPVHGRPQEPTSPVHVVVDVPQHLILVLHFVSDIDREGLQRMDLILELVSHPVVLLLDLIALVLGKGLIVIASVRATHFGPIQFENRDLTSKITYALGEHPLRSLCARVIIRTYRFFVNNCFLHHRMF